MSLISFDCLSVTYYPLSVFSVCVFLPVDPGQQLKPVLMLRHSIEDKSKLKYSILF